MLGSCVLLAGGGDEGERPCVRDGLQPTLHGHCGCDGVYHSRGGDLFGEVRFLSHHFSCCRDLELIPFLLEICRVIGAVIIVIGLYALARGMSSEMIPL